MSASWTETFGTLTAWRRQRLPHGLFVPAAAALVLASAVGQELSVWTALRLPVAWLVIALLRLWDDLEDREADRLAHPERVWLGEDVGRIGLLIAGGLAGMALWTPLLMGLAAGVFLFYRVRPGALEAVLLLKYPLLVGVLRGSVDAEGLAAMAWIYAGMLLDSDEWVPGVAGCWIGTTALVWLAPFPGAGLLALGLFLPWVKPVLGRPGLLTGIVVELLAFHLVTR